MKIHCFYCSLFTAACAAFLGAQLPAAKLPDPFQMVGWQVPCSPGKLEAVAVTFEISGPGQIIVGNGAPNSDEPEKGNQRSLFNGPAQVIMQSTKEAGEIKLTATANGLSPATVVVKSSQTKPIPAVP